MCDLDIVRQNIDKVEQHYYNPVLIVMSGLPGTGKTYISRRIKDLTDVVLLESDLVRKILFNPPKYTRSENARLFDGCHSLIKEYLNEGMVVVFDATNLIERNRRYLYTISETAGARLMIIKVEAPFNIVKKRLTDRTNGNPMGDTSDADLLIYHRLRASEEPILKEHFVIDTSKDIDAVINNVVGHIRGYTNY